MSIEEELLRLRQEMRELRQRTARSERSVEQFKDKTKRLEDKVKTLEEKNKQLEDEKRGLEDEIASLKAYQAKLQSMLFKANAASPLVSTPDKKRLRGGQTGHRGHGRRRPIEVDEEKAIFLTHCPNCERLLNESDAAYARTIQDIPEAHVITTRYLIQRQWCPSCQKEVHAIPKDTIPGMQIGLRTVILICFLKYRLRTPLAKISEFLKSHHDIHVTQGGIQKILHILSQKFIPECQQILKEIRAAPIKHADETSWRIMGRNGWCWLFATPNAALYTIEESRGKGVPQRILGACPEGVLVRDDYPSYDCLKTMQHQSCWAHLLRVAHEAMKQPTVSQEMKELHQEINLMFAKLDRVVKKPFETLKRRAMHTLYAKHLRVIEHRRYAAKDAKSVQTRMKNQGDHLITALLHPDVPLTNNFAERQIRPVAVMRKISGGSQSKKGATIHAVNMTFMQTVALKGQSYLKELRRALTISSQGLVLEKSE